MLAHGAARTSCKCVDQSVHHESAVRVHMWPADQTSNMYSASGRTSMQHRASDVRPEGTACKLHCLHNFKRQKRNVMCAHGPPDEGPYKGPIRARGTPRGKASDAK